VQAYGPATGKDVPVDRPISITFDRPMIQPLAEQSLRIEPAVEGAFSWQGNTLQFSPRHGWSRSTTLRRRKARS
jgi:hypothetical protein